ncbi:alpha-2-macroglobulin-like [Mastacembelus armatus]|uniref:alpha-2-macroglobulin-like n=1 Tax=Mastacembelus armatus TaxID=205130 RepID=UPI000E45651C|nr:alpha-2-macroglobulin-like [Mastacembelus armatus]
MCGEQVLAGPQYMVAVPAVLEAGAETKFCASLLQPNETLVVTVSLTSEGNNSTLLKQTSSEEFHICAQFKVPLVKKQEVQKFEVEVRGDTFYSKEVRKVMIQVYQPMTFVQTDKPLYLPGQTVHFRVVTLDTKFRPANRLDANYNRIGQWLNETSNSKILQLSYTLSSEVKIDTVEEVNIDQEQLQVKVCAMYTFGQPVPGSVKDEICQRCKRYMCDTYSSSHRHTVNAQCHHETKKTDEKGCATFAFMMSTFTKFDQTVLEEVLDLKANMEEDGTGISQAEQKEIRISYEVGKLSFIDTPSVYEQGSNVEGKVKAVFHNNTPIADMPVHLFEGEVYSARLLQNLTTDSDGVAVFSISTGDRTGNIHLHISNEPTMSYLGYRVSYYETGYHRVSEVQQFSPDVKTVSSLQVKNKDKPLSCDKEEEIFIQYTIVGEAQGSVDVMYLVLSRGAITMQGLKPKLEVQDKAVTQGEVSFKLKLSPEMAPFVQVVAYAVLPSETVIANSANFSTEKCFSHKESLEFSPSSTVPGEKTIMQVTADPDSLCGVSAVDRSVLIEEPGKGLDADKIFNLLPVTKVSSIPNEALDSIGCLNVRARRCFAIFYSVGLKMATNLFIQMPPCVLFRGRVYHLDIVHYGIRIFDEPPPIVTVRTFFPETWIWDLVEVGESGTKDVSLTVPDTITTWETEAFCLSPQGFGLAPRKEITVFQPFFLELTLPYSIIQGEHFELKATTFSYLTSCIMVTVTPAPSLDYTLTPLSGDQYTSCLCGSEHKTLSWTMTPSTLGTVNVSVTAEAVASQASCDNEIVTVPERGRIDVVTKSLIVKAEGIEVEKTYNWLLCPKVLLLSMMELHEPEFVVVYDTVVALQALALYSTLVFSPEGSSTVTVQSPSGQLTFDVNQNNKLLYQEKMLQDLTGKYSLEVKGTACVSMQLSLHYNIPTPTDVTTLSVEVTPEVDCTKSHRPKLTLKLQSLYSGKETSTNMVILDIKMLSGFVPDPESLKRLKGALLVDRVEQNEDHVVVYITELTKDTTINHQLELIQELPVENLKPAVVKIYDYYQPSDQAETEYSYHCAAD